MSDVTLYQLEHCPFCHRVRHMLGAHGADYRIVNVPLKQDARDEVERVSGQRSVPVLVVDGEAFTDQLAIGTKIAEHWPTDHETIGEFERSAAPVFIARLDTDDVEEAQTRVFDAMRRCGIEPRREDVTVPGVERSFLLEGEYMQRFVDIEPRTRATLPLRAAIAPHENGLSVQLHLPGRLWFHMRNLELARATWKFQSELVDALHLVAEKSNV